MEWKGEREREIRFKFDCFKYLCGICSGDSSLNNISPNDARVRDRNSWCGNCVTKNEIRFGEERKNVVVWQRCCTSFGRWNFNTNIVFFSFFLTLTISGDVVSNQTVLRTSALRDEWCDGAGPPGTRCQNFMKLMRQYAMKQLHVATTNTSQTQFIYWTSIGDDCNTSVCLWSAKKIFGCALVDLNNGRATRTENLNK